MDFKLWHGCCLEEMKKIEDNSIDMVLCDLPYGITASWWDTVIPFEMMWGRLMRVLKLNAPILLFAAEPFASQLRMSNKAWYRYDWIWRKTEPSGHLNAKKMPLKTCEFVCVFYLKPPKYYPIKTKGHKRKTALKVPRGDKDQVYGRQDRVTNYDSTERYPTEVLDFSRKKQTNKLHPNQKPVALLEYLIKTYTLENETVLDFTMGSGSTGVAAKNLNRKFIGIERDDKYFEIAKERISNA